MPDGSTRLGVPWPLDVEELREILEPLASKYRVIHLANATKASVIRGPPQK